MLWKTLPLAGLSSGFSNAANLAPGLLFLSVESN